MTLRVSESRMAGHSAIAAEAEHTRPLDLERIELIVEPGDPLPVDHLEGRRRHRVEEAKRNAELA
jgi:hypothetical protein